MKTSGTLSPYLWLTLLMLCHHHAECCPAQCQCMAASGGGERVICPSGQTSLPLGLAADTKTLVIRGRPLPQRCNNIPQLKKSDFTSLTSLEELTLPFANLSEIEDDAFSVLVNLKRLSLHNNRLKRLTPRTFFGLGNLDYLDLTNNAGCVIQGDVFSQLVLMKNLYLGSLELKEVKAEWFKSLTFLESLDLHGNDIEYVTPDFLQNLAKMKMLDLTGNRLQALTPSLRPTITSIAVVYLGGNPWHCNCEMRWFKQLRSPAHSSDDVVCITPAALAFVDVTNVPDNEMACQPPQVIRCGGPYDVNAGNDIVMECVVEGDPFPVVEWSKPDGTVVDTTKPGWFSSAQKTVNSTGVTVADFSAHHGQWSATAKSSQGSNQGNFIVNVFTTTSTTTTTTMTSTKRTRAATKTTPVSAIADDQAPAAATVETSNLWFYIALVAFGISALALTSLILVAAFKIRKNQRQVGTDQRRDSGLSLGSETSAGLRSRVI